MYYRDIASRNCLVNSQRMVKLADFGMTRCMEDNNYYRLSRKGEYLKNFFLKLYKLMKIKAYLLFHLLCNTGLLTRHL